MVMVKESGSHYETPEAGTYPATCIRVIDLGTQENEYKGEKIKKRQVIISWELAEKMTTGEPFLIGQFYTASLSEKSKLRPMLESWRGAAFTSEELEGFDLSKLLGKSCLVSLIKNEKGKTKVSSVSKLPKGIEGPALTGKTVHFDLDKFDKSVFDSLPNKIKEMIEKSPEYDLVAAGHVKSEAVEEEEPVREEGETEEVPF